VDMVARGKNLQEGLAEVGRYLQAVRSTPSFSR
jgi:hypothetical protein